MKIISLIVLVLALASCSESGGGSGGNGGLGNGPGAGTTATVKTGVAINNDSSSLARNIAGKSWCSQKQYFDEPNDPNKQNPFVEVFSFFDTGKMEVYYAEVNTGNPSEKTLGEWGASETQMSLSAGGQTVNFAVSYDDAKKEITATATGGEAEVYSQCTTN